MAVDRGMIVAEAGDVLGEPFAGEDRRTGDGQPPSDLARIRLIDRRMDYRLAEDEGESRVSDAVAVAVLLGLEPAVAARADHFFKDN